MNAYWLPPSAAVQSGSPGPFLLVRFKLHIVCGPQRLGVYGPWPSFCFQGVVMNAICLNGIGDFDPFSKQASKQADTNRAERLV